MQDTKTCSTCSLTLPYSNFSNNAKSKDGKGYVCKSCSSYKRKQYYEANKDKEMALCASWRANNKEYVREASSKYRKRYPEKVKAGLASWYAKNKDTHKDKCKDYATINKSTVNSIHAKRRASKLNASPKWLSDAHKEQIADLYWLAKDLEAISGEHYHVDHIVPLQGKTVCGLHVPWNLQVLPASDNIKKKNNYDDWKEYANK